MDTMLFTLAEAAERLRVSVRTVEREAADGRLALVRIRSRRMVDPAELARYIAAASQQAQPCPSANEATATKCASASAAIAALNAHFQRAQRSPTRARSKSRLAAPASTLRLVGPRNT
jgi:excisionase family DNA binding protein